MLVALLCLLLAPAVQQLETPWKDVAAGVAVAPAAQLGADSSWSARVVLIDPLQVQFLVRYDPSRPTLGQWLAKYPQAIAVMNGSFYSVEGKEVKPTCEIIAEGKATRGAGCHRQDALFFGAKGKAVCPGVHYCAESSRTAAIAQLKDGRILLFASQWPAVRKDVAEWLAEEMGALHSLNLDGGPEATLALGHEPAEEAVGTPGVGLPMVLLVLPQ
jgi:hypothetical protein